MKNHEKIRETFSALHASGECMTEVLKMTIQKEKKTKPHALWKIALAAAIIACLGITVAASEGKLWGRAEQNNEEWKTIINGQVVELPAPHLLNVQIEMTIGDSVPSRIQSIYTPANVKDNEWLCMYIDQNNSRANSQWRPEGWKEYITLTQTACGCISDGIFRTMTSAVPTEDYYAKIITREAREYFYLSSDRYETDGVYAGYSQILYWTDGDYVFSLEFPYWMEMDQAWEIVDNLRRVDDVNGLIRSIDGY